MISTLIRLLFGKKPTVICLNGRVLAHQDGTYTLLNAKLPDDLKFFGCTVEKD